ncbi:S8 family serine peptidase [Halorussus sp. MSC15.2]|uniref:S8 family peptidase n=1 Tax=Halorussus sp. MSC15.2 TaxID=2283638 RepID=UPI0013D243AF|nr:S8 family serine peptidase [Halorussus sp. MSC15.2]NEU56350.1 S8 family serine peptidase [Halorussus sp. MSC15.2]
MGNKTNRRTFLKGAGAALGGLAFTATVSAKSVEDRYIVDLRDTAEGDLEGLTVVHDLSQIDIAVVEGDEKALRGMRHSKDVEMRYEVDEEYDEEDDEGDGDEDEDGTTSRRELQWDKHSQNTGEVLEETAGQGTRVAVIDSGAIPNHPDLSSPLNTDLSKNFTGDGGDFTPWYNDHGTHVAGIIAADGSNTDGVVGTAPGTELVALRVFTGPFAFFGDIIAAMTYAGDIEADVANLSLGVYPLPDNEENQTLRDSIERATDYAASQGTLMVAAAGNDGANLDNDGDVLSLPNEADNVMSVSATGPIGFRWDDGASSEEDGDGEVEEPLEDLRKPTTTPASYTNFGREAIDISAPGGNSVQNPPSDANWQYDMVLSTTVTWDDDDNMVADYGWKAGTSMAAPQVSAAAALVKSANPDAKPGQVRRHLEATAEDVDQPKYSGEGHLDLEEAVEEEIEHEDEEDEDD